MALNPPGFGVPHRVARPVQVKLTRSLFIPSDYVRRCEQTPAAFITCGHPLVMIGTWGLYLATNRAVFPLVERTTIAHAPCSVAAATAAMATVSTVSVGNGIELRSSSYRGG